jgi:hypothetical protein
MTLGKRLEHRYALGAERQAVGGVLDVAAGDDDAAGRLESSSHAELGVVGARVPPRLPRRSDQGLARRRQ